MKVYFYFIVFVLPGGGWGNSEASFPVPITHIDQLVRLAESIRQDFAKKGQSLAGSVVITSFQLLRIENVDEPEKKA